MEYKPDTVVAISGEVEHGKSTLAHILKKHLGEKDTVVVELFRFDQFSSRYSFAIAPTDRLCALETDVLVEEVMVEKLKPFKHVVFVLNQHVYLGFVLGLHLTGGRQVRHINCRVYGPI